jgi:hypothetical protein
MQVFCGNCQLNFEAPDGASGLVCPICRNPLQPQATEGGNGAAAAAPDKHVQDWNGGTLDDLIALLTGPALSARVEVLAAGSQTPAGEVHLLAGGVSDALLGGKSTDDALDKLRAVPNARFRIEGRLPNPADGDLATAGPVSGTLDARPLAHLMRYCEDYVITCGIEVWRGNENARVDYRRGEISGVTVGGIDAPERLAEVMQWASGNYRLIVPPISVPAVAPRRPQAASAAPAPVPAPAPSAQAAQAAAQAARQSSATKTMFGMPAPEVAAIRAAADAARAEAARAASPAPAAAGAPAAVVPPSSPTATMIGTAPAPAVPTAAAAAPTAPMPTTPPGVPPSAIPPPIASSRLSATKTIFGVPAADVVPEAAPARATPASRQAERESAAPAAAASTTDSGRAERKTGARKVAVPPPEISPPIAAAAPPAAAAVSEPPAAGSTRIPTDIGRSTHQGYDPARVQPAAPGKKPATDDKTQPTRLPPQRGRATPIWAYVGVGFTFGLALLGIYQLVGRLAH